MINGIVNINKPSGISSSLAVSKVRRALGERKIGHMGTLDPMGEGVLLMGVGKCTRLFDYFLGKTKTYEAAFRFGFSTDTLDITGKTIAQTIDIPTMTDIVQRIPEFFGVQMQMPPQYSAKSVGGQRAYDLARKGVTAELKASQIEVNSFDLLKKTDENEYLFRIDCSSGTYIRSLCRDLATALGSLATMTSIKRTRCGNFFIEDSVSPEAVTASDVKSPKEALAGMTEFEAPEAFYGKLTNGVPVMIDNAPTGKFVLYCAGELLGIAGLEDRGVKIITYLKED